MKHFIYIVLLVAACSVQAAQVSKDYLKANRYNIKGQIAGEIFPDPDKHNDGLVFPATRYTYNSNGQLSNTQTGYLSAWQNETIAPKDWTGFTVQSQVIIGYDGYGRKIRETQAKSDGTALQITQYSYDTSDRLKCQAVRMNTSTFGSLSSNACSLVSSSEGMTDRITQYEYDSKNRIKTIKKAVGTTVTQSYARYTYDQFWQ
ncbi:hypothetical protein ACFO4O_14645 [Glaciecola siphonariae]|uniref:YD repeat-containing protein n=1 Tax=Glaciecola siphonariae TaxID=521012 RepID=A0ABV9LZW4_9ALTE